MYIMRLEGLDGEIVSLDQEYEHWLEIVNGRDPAEVYAEEMERFMLYEIEECTEYNEPMHLEWHKALRTVVKRADIQARIRSIHDGESLNTFLEKIMPRELEIQINRGSFLGRLKNIMHGVWS